MHGIISELRLKNIDNNKENLDNWTVKHIVWKLQKQQTYILENSFTITNASDRKRRRPKNSKTGKISQKVDFDQEQTLSESLILAQDERWRRA